ncbi:MAG: D-glycero-beta-D-manno-heptose 1-phosphate adenylyltransferase [Saprospiraceae bacterium]|nr:D-glycero-beta-D-manno-heptose 1-phosphate adenylyltransferase [Saprospiraceae bacterium]
MSTPSFIHKIKELPEALAILNRIKDAGGTVVFTNGCFDILHKGHVRYLDQAAELGTLVVGVNSDESVRRLKGNSRPLNNVNDRCELLAALSSTSLIVVFEEDTPLNLIEKLLPDILLKGGDYKAEEIVGYKTVIENGGDVLTLPFTKGYSSSAIIEKGK